MEKNIEEAINSFKSEDPFSRYTSFDYCYNYFKISTNLTQDIEKSCNILGFYLASWGMLRGSSFLLQMSSKHYESLINYFQTLDKSYWDIDIDNYNTRQNDILNIYNDTKNLILDKNKDRAHLTLVTKILLGVFGFIPAFDSYFCLAFKELYKGKCSFNSVNKESLNILYEFYSQNKITIDKCSSEIKTIGFLTGEKTNIVYPKAKIVDMYGFQIGFEKSNLKLP